MKPFTTLSALWLCFAPAMTWSQTPMEATRNCPIGGEEYTITTSEDCSVIGRAMSFRNLTTCEFKTAMAVCPGNGLPIYQRFSADQLTEIEAFMATPEYSQLMQRNKWERAYGIAVHLGQGGTDTGLRVLLSAFRVDTETFLATDGLMDLLLAEAEEARTRASETERPLFEAIIAFTLIHAGRSDEADIWLTRAANGPDLHEYVKSYIDAVRACQDEPQRAGCGPDDPFEP